MSSSGSSAGADADLREPPSCLFSVRRGDVTFLRLLLTQHIRPPLPPEIAFQIIDAAEYWPAICASLSQEIEVTEDTGGGHRALLVTPPLPGHVKRVTWWLKSHDQGWNSYGFKNTYSYSWTWFEAVIARPRGGGDSPADQIATYFDHLPARSDDLSNWKEEWDMVEEPQTKQRRWRVQTNVNSRREEKEHTIHWRLEDDRAIPEEHNPETGTGCGKSFVKLLRPGDRIVLVARAMFPAWRNHVLGAKVEARFV